MDAFLNPCVRSDGERLDPSLSPAPSLLAEDGRGVLYALGAEGVIRACPARLLNAAARGSITEDALPTRVFKPEPPIDFEPRTISVSPSGHFAAVGGLRHDASVSPHSIPPSSALVIVSLRQGGEGAGGFDAVEDGSPGCRRVDLMADDFARHPSLKPLRASWHPNSDGHLCVLLSDGTLRVFDAASGPCAEQAFRLDPWGRGSAPGPYPLRPEVVDFEFAPPHGWGALSLVMLGREGDLYTMCPFAPWGARYPRVTLESLSAPDETAEVWLSNTFPTLRRNRGRGEDDDEDEQDGYEDDGDGYEDDASDDELGGGSDDDAFAGPTVAARPARIEGVAAALRGPLPMGTEPVDGEGGVLGRGAVARSLAAAPFAAGEGGGALLAVVHQRMSASPVAPDEGTVAATLDVLILPREPAPAWAVLSEEDEAAAYEAASYDGGPVVTLTPLATDDDDASIQPLLAIDRVELASGESTLRRPKTSVSALQNELAPFVSVTWDPACRDRVFVCAGGAVHGVTLTWLAAVEGAVDDEEGEKSGGELSLPAVVTLMDSPEVLLGVAPCGDPLAEGLLLAVDATGAAYGLHPAPPLPEGIDANDDDDAVMSSASAALAGDAEASAELRALAAGPSGPPPAPPAGAAALKPGTIEGNAALAAAATALKERHLRYAHRVHAATKRHSLRLGAELRRQRVEANAIRDGLESVRRRKEILAQKIGQSVANHEDIRERLRKLAEAERSLPHPLTRAESAFQTTLQANADDLPLLEAKLEELKRRCEEIGEDFATMGRMAAGDHVSSFEKLAASDPEIAKEVESQDAATRANLERVRQIELAVGSLDGV